MSDFPQEVKDYADAIHQLICRANHTDQCGWMYGEQQRYWNYRDTEKLLPKLREVVTPEQLKKIAQILRP
jgi:hypothetical protein